MKKKIQLFWIIGIFAVILSAIFSILYGAASIAPKDVFHAIFHFDPNQINHQIIIELRIPRTIGDILIGASFATAGALMQGMTRNPLADSGLLGINYGATFALSLCFSFFATMNYSLVVIFSLLGAALATAVVYGVTSMNHGKQTPARLALAGSGVGIFLSALSQAIAMYYNVARESSFWSIGGVGRIRSYELSHVSIFIIIGLIMAIFLSKYITLLSLGEDTATGLGLNVNKVKKYTMINVFILAGSSVALAGPIGFIGLIVPHLVRNFVGIDYKKVIPASMLLGSILVLVADICSRMINPPHETSIGLIFAIIGVPFFLMMTRKKGSDQSV